MASLTMDNVTTKYGKVVGIDSLGLSVGDGEFFVILGPSGAGKTTTLKSVAGLVDIDAGTVSIGGREMTGVEPYHRNVAMAFESYALYPQRTVFENLASPLKSGRTGTYSKSDQEKRIELVTTTLGINHLLKRFPRELSNGQRQRVALGRVLVRPADVYLLDEPLSHLDAKLRAAMWAELKQLGEQSSTTSLYVTHDYQEALDLGERIAVLRSGRLIQVGTPEQIWREPADTFVAKALGQPEMNLLDAVVENGTIQAAGGAISFPVPRGLEVERRVRVGLRPRDLDRYTDGAGGLRIRGRVHLAERLGRLVELAVEVGDTELIMVASSDHAAEEGEGIDMVIDHADVHLFAPGEPGEETARLGSGAPPGLGRAAMTAAPLTLEKLHKTYVSRGREPFEAVKGMDLQIRPGELIALLGPSGCGKTTTLRMIAGLETVTSGSIRIGDREVQDLAPGKRDIGVGFESYALYPPLNVKENLGYGLKARRVRDAGRQVEQMAERLEMTELLPLRPASLSSGQKQRVALARALIRNPRVLLLDEPLSHLDAAQRQRVRRELKVLQREFGYTTIVVTHDQLEALSLADRMAVMNAGVIEQFGTPDEIYDDPANVFVADFVGEPKINLFEGTVVRRGGDTLVAIGRDGLLKVDATTPADGQAVTVGLRPQDTRPPVGDEPAFTSSVVVYEDFMEFGLATLEVPGVDGRLVAQLPHGLQWRRGEDRKIAARSDRVYLFDPETGRRLR